MSLKWQTYCAELRRRTLIKTAFCGSPATSSMARLNYSIRRMASLTKSPMFTKSS